MICLILAQTGAAAAGGGDDSYFLWGCALLGVSIAIFALEFFVPSGGLLGLLCGVTAIGSIVAFFMYDNTWGWAIFLAYLVLGPLAVWGFFKLWVNSSIGRSLILGGEEMSGAGSDEAEYKSESDRRHRLDALRELIGAEGVTVTSLRPVGVVRINDTRTDAIAETGVIEANTEVIVVDVRDNQIKVRVR